jgi:hypothetical protein
MKKIRKPIAAILAAILTYGVFFGTMTPSFAAAEPVRIIVDNYSNGKLDFHWEAGQLSGIKAAVITYHAPDSANFGTLQKVVLRQTANTASVTGLKSDYIYDLRLALYDSDILDANGDPTGNMLGEGLLYYLPKISFYSEAPSQPYDEIPGGGRESGRTPKLKLRWKIPRVWFDDPSNPNESTKKFILADNAAVMEQMQNALNAVYNDGRQIAKLNFRINISTDLGNLNTGSSSVIIKNEGSGYKAYIPESTIPPAVIAPPDASDYVSFELWGRSDSNSTVPPRGPGDENVLPNDKLYPGSVYYMNIKPVYNNASGEDVNAVTVGNLSDQNGSLLSGSVSYAYTPIRFQLTKDSSNNIYVKIYKINKGSLDLPRLFYEVQASDNSAIPGDWTVKKTMDDSYFSGDYAVTVISGVDPNSQIYYKIVVKSDSSKDRLESLKLPYTLIVDTNRPPLPMGIAITNRVLHNGQVTPPAAGSTAINVRSTDVTISWDKPLNWTTGSAISYHFLLSTSQTDVAGNVPMYVDGTYWGSYPSKYRLVKYINADNSKITAVGNRLYYTLDAFDLFTWEKAGNITGAISNTEGYPSFLLPNTVYYLQMYTTAADDAGTAETDRMSDRSVVVSFTTLNGVELDVPLPKSFGLDANGKNTNAVPPVNYVDLKFDKVTNLDWNNYTSSYDAEHYNYNIYYDIYMSSRTSVDSFTLIGSTEDLHGDVVFTGADDPASTSVKARISTFTEPALKSLFGDRLLPNTTYYFKARTRLVITKKSDNSRVGTDKESIDTAILPVTTVVLDIQPPDDSQRKPLAPTDFSIKVDGNGDQLLSGSSVTFTWKRQEDDVAYQLIRTGRRVSPGDKLDDYKADPEYTSFLEAYDLPSDGIDNGLVYLDPAPEGNRQTDPGKFTYDSATKTCTYTVDRRMFPNKLYYFSLKAVRVARTAEGYTPGSESVWISIPVTTSLIQSPEGLEAVIDAELGFFWTDGTAGMTAEDYVIYAKRSDETEYKLMTRSHSTIVKDTDGRTYYGRLLNLKIDSSYDIRVYKGAGSSGTLVYENSGLRTRDGYHELEIKWTGIPVDDFSRYEIAVMAEGSSDYTLLSGNDLEYYPDKNGRLLPYYTEETPLTVNKDTVCFHARIKQAEVVLPGGLAAHQPLRSNMKYYIKVRAVKVDPADTALISYSKYIGPVNSRTEFSQDDYDDTDNEEKEEAVFLDRIKQLEQGYYWRLGTGSSAAVRILLKGERVVNALQSTPESTFTVDMTAINVDMGRDEVYVPVSVVRAMNSANKSLLIRTAGADFLLRPDTLDASENKQIKELLAKTAVKDLYLRLTVVRTDTVPTGFPASGERISKINDLEMQAIGSSRTDSELKKQFDDRLYNEDGGLVSEKLNMLKNAYIGTGPDASKLMNEYIERLVEMIENELSAYIDSTMESVRLISATQSITEFASPVSASLNCSDRQGTKLPYVLYDGTQTWQKIANNTQKTGSVTLNVIKTGKYVVLLAQGGMTGVPDGYWAREYISSLTSKYDLSDVFSGIGTSFMPDNKVTCREVILLYEKVTGKSVINTGLDLKQKSAKLGLDGVINPNGIMKNIRRQETAGVLLQLFAVKKGVSADSLRPGGNIYINDEADIDAAYFYPVLMIVDMGVMDTDSGGNFMPGANMTRAEVSVAFVKLLKLTGDM